MRVDTFLICDDIRNEIGGKQSLMGIYGDTLQFEVPPVAIEQWPKALKIGIFIRLGLDSDDRKHTNISFRLDSVRNDITTKIGEGTIPLWQNAKADKLNITFIQNPFLVPGIGAITFKISCFSDSKKEIPLSNASTTIRVEQKVISLS